MENKNSCSVSGELNSVRFLNLSTASYNQSEKQSHCILKIKGFTKKLDLVWVFGRALEGSSVSMEKLGH